VSISDEIVLQKNERGLTEFQRTLSLKSDGAAGVMWYRAAAGNSIEAKDGWFVVDEHLHVEIKGANAAAVVRKIGGKAELLLRFDLTNGPVEILQRYAW
jgi:hypothetical protein